MNKEHVRAWLVQARDTPTPWQRLCAFAALAFIFWLGTMCGGCAPERDGEQLDASDSLPTQIVRSTHGARDAQSLEDGATTARDASASAVRDAAAIAVLDASAPAVRDAAAPLSLVGMWLVHRDTQDAPQPCTDFNGNPAFPSADETWTITQPMAGLVVQGSALRELRGTATATGAAIAWGDVVGSLALDTGDHFGGTLSITATAPTPWGMGGTYACTTVQTVNAQRKP